MKAIILSVGDELVSGQTVDTNSAHLARRLGELGIAVAEHRTVGDDRRAVTAALTAAADVAELLLVTGGLGPTADDLTRQALADALGVELVLDRNRLAEIEAFFRRPRADHAADQPHPGDGPGRGQVDAQPAGDRSRHRRTARPGRRLRAAGRAT